MNFVRREKYIESEIAIYEFVFIYKPNIIVELGYGTGAMTVAMANAVSTYNGKIFSYDLHPTAIPESQLNLRNLSSYCSCIQGNVYDTYLSNPFSFDLLVLDINLYWSDIYDIVINNIFINDRIKNKSKVIIEGGADDHTRINRFTLDRFHESIGKRVFEFNHLAGKRTSISELVLL